jgi:subtilisin family serine protease
MKKVTLAVALALLAAGANAQSKFDASSRLALDYYKIAANSSSSTTVVPADLPFVLNPLSRAETTAKLFVSLNEGFETDKIEALGFDIIAQSNGILLLNGPLSQVEKLAELDAVKSISFGKTAKAKLDIARDVTGVDVIHSGGDNLPQAYNGTGVITGIYDTGLDPNHPNFKDSNNESRVSRVWYYKSDTGDPTEYLTSDAIARCGTDSPSETHGTHTLGCMAGSYNGTGTSVYVLNSKGNSVLSPRAKIPYYGMSTNSEIVVAGGSLTTTCIMDGISKIINYAKEQGKPTVINISIGSAVGPHDGKDEESQMMEGYCKDAVICIAAGNEGEDKMSIVKTFTASDNSYKTFVNPLYSSDNSGKLDIWSSNSDDFTVTAAIYDISTGSITYSYQASTATERSASVSTSNYTNSGYIHNSEFDKAFSSSAWLISTSKNKGTNNRTQVTIQYQLTNNTASNADGNLVFAIIVEGKAGQRVDLANNSSYTELSNKGISGWTDGTADLSISSMACTEGIIPIGAWNTRAEWPGIGSKYGYYADYNYNIVPSYDVDRIAGYSSYGTLYDGRTLPIVCAPGTGIISSISSYYTDQTTSSDINTCSAKLTKNSRTYYWQCQQGTSMACPVAAGIAALWLQADPTLTASEVINVMKQTATVDDAVTGTGNAVQWGAGKINALAGIKYVLGLGSVNNVAVDANDKMIVSPAGDNAWEVFVPGANNVSAALYSTSGQLVAKVNSNSDTATLSANNVAKGIYILNANGTQSTRVIVK